MNEDQIIEVIDTFEESQLIEVCDVCLKAACWYGEFKCIKAQNAGTTLKTKAELRELGREHPEYWLDIKLEEIYGCVPHKKIGHFMYIDGKLVCLPPSNSSCASCGA